jgi:hypothetical protein
MLFKAMAEPLPAPPEGPGLSLALRAEAAI